ncbi:MAG: DNA repair exonuclease [Planctomycetia bacterium]|jgi:DNA repair exonuclease SbcCD nuclease subunit
MSNWPFRFIHSAHFHLETPPFGVREVPEVLYDRFLKAAYTSATRMFDAAITEEVDFVLLAGDLLDPRQTGPRGPLFLVEQFQKLAEKKIRVYWAGGTTDPPEAWPPSIRLPENVHRFQSGKPQEILHRRDDTPLARIAGLARSGTGRFVPLEFEPDSPGLFAIGLTNGSVELEHVRASRVDYWALGGLPKQQTFSKTMPVVHYPGMLQGRQPSDVGTYGCTLVQVDRERNVQMTLLPCDVLRWHQERIDIPADMERDDLILELEERLENLANATPGTDLLVSLTGVGTGKLVTQLRQGIHTHEILTQLREDFGTREPAVWTVSLDVQTSNHPGQWYEQDSIRGDFLRSIEQLDKDATAPLGLDTMLESAALPAATKKMLLDTDRVRGDVLSKAASLGVDLLGTDQEGENRS